MQRAPSHYQPILQDISTYPTLRRRLRGLLLLSLGETGESFRFQGERGEKRQARGLETNSDGPHQLAAWVLSFMPVQPCLITAAARASMEQVHADRAGGCPSHPSNDLRGGARDLSALMARRQNPYCMAWHKLGKPGIPRIWGGRKGGVTCAYTPCHVHGLTTAAAKLGMGRIHPPVELSWIDKQAWTRSPLLGVLRPRQTAARHPSPAQPLRAGEKKSHPPSSITLEPTHTHTLTTPRPSPPAARTHHIRRTWKR